MAHIHQSKLALRVSGDSLVPAELTQLLGANPTFCHAKGDRIENKNTGRFRVAASGLWNFRVNDQSPEMLDVQFRELFGSLTQDLSAWRQISERYSADLFVGLFMSDTNEGLTISTDVMHMIAERQLEIGFDVYGPEVESAD